MATTGFVASQESGHTSHLSFPPAVTCRKPAHEMSDETRPGNSWIPWLSLLDVAAAGRKPPVCSLTSPRNAAYISEGALTIRTASELLFWATFDLAIAKIFRRRSMPVPNRGAPFRLPICRNRAQGDVSGKRSGGGRHVAILTGGLCCVFRQGSSWRYCNAR